MLVDQQFLSRVRDCVAVKAQVISAVFRPVNFKQANFAAGLQFLDVRDQCHGRLSQGWKVCWKVAVMA